MNPSEQPIIHVQHLVRRYGATDAVDGLNLSVRAGQCYGFFGRNGAGKTTTIKCLLNLLKPTSGSVRLFGLDPAKAEVAVKERLAYVPDQVAFYPWLTVNQTLRYLESFRRQWNHRKEKELISQFDLGVDKKISALSKGQKTQLSLIAAICPEPELLILDEPTSGLDPIVRREFIETIIGAYQESDPLHRTIFLSTHLISEFEGLIDQFTIIERGQAILSLESDAAREQFKRIRVRFAGNPPAIHIPGILQMKQDGRELEVVANGASEKILEQLRLLSPENLVTESLTLEEIFRVSVSKKETA